ncbi:lysozyme inhibitor LprI family protein [Neoroseomonas alba]|nr:lysozyme inhibitor LprI family protein [Neoroseomonas alba]
MRMVLLGVLALCVVSEHARAQASFDCARAASAIERAICAAPELAQLDRQLSQIYAQKRASTQGQQRQVLTDEQRAWIRSRDAACRADRAVNTECLAGLYRGRIAELSGATAPDGWTGRWRYARAGFTGEMQIAAIVQGRWRITIQTAMDSGNVSTCELTVEAHEVSGRLIGRSDDIEIVVSADRGGVQLTQRAGSSPCGLNATFEGPYLRSGG